MLCKLSFADSTYVAFYPMTSCTGGQDLSEFKNEATMYSVTHITGVEGEPAAGTQFAGLPTSYMSIPTTPNIDVQYSMTILVHVLVEGPGPVLNFGTSQSLGLHIISSGLDSHDILFLPVEREGSISLKRADSPIKSGEWVYVAATYDYKSGMGKLYLDSKSVSNFQLDAETQVKSNADVYIGSYPDADDDFVGAIACLRIYDKVITADELNSGSECPFGRCHY